jgi:hypothetical protein
MDARIPEWYPEVWSLPLCSVYLAWWQLRTCSRPGSTLPVTQSQLAPTSFVKLVQCSGDTKVAGLPPMVLLSSPWWYRTF